MGHSLSFLRPSSAYRDAACIPYIGFIILKGEKNGLVSSGQILLLLQLQSKYFLNEYYVYVNDYTGI